MYYYYNDIIFSNIYTGNDRLNQNREEKTYEGRSNNI